MQFSYPFLLSITHKFPLAHQGSAANELQTKTHKNYVGDKRYELSKHLGNVLTVITDRKLLSIPIVNAGFRTGETHPFIPTPQANSISVESGHWLVLVLVCL